MKSNHHEFLATNSHCDSMRFSSSIYPPSPPSPNILSYMYVHSVADATSTGPTHLMVSETKDTTLFHQNTSPSSRERQQGNMCMRGGRRAGGGECDSLLRPVALDITRTSEVNVEGIGGGEYPIPCLRLRGACSGQPE